MSTAKVFTAFGLVAAFGFAITNCGGDTATPTGAGGSAGAPSGAGGTAGTPGGGQGGSGMSMSNVVCPSTGGASCNQAESDAYSQCVVTKCETDMKACFGDGFKTGAFSGPCGAYITCTSKCACTDNGCRAACAMAGDCTTCLTGKVVPCVLNSGCRQPMCGPGGGMGGTGGTPPVGGTCADLQACCASMTGPLKMACDAQVKAGASAGAAYCSAALMGYRASNLCK